MDRHSSIKDEPGGYTILEVLIGGILVAIVAIALFQVISQGSFLNRKELVRRRCFQEMERVLENTRYSSRSPYYLALPLGNPVDSLNVVLDDRGDTATANNLTGTIRIRVDSVSFTYNSVVIPAKKVMAKITYSDNGTAYQDSLQTIITMTDIN
jgi:type II secretory pathway pseudopilin PulG